MKFIPAKEIWQQLKQDLIGKDAFRGITLSYAWLANQFGHFALGFIPTTLLYLWNSGKTTGNRGIYWPSLVVWGFWLAFELLNFIWSVIRSNKNPVVKKQAKKIFYRSKRMHFVFDTVTDLFFFGLGVTFSCLIFTPSFAVIMVAVTLVCILVPSSYYWYGAKIYVQRAMYPFQFRISQWTRRLSDANRDAINKFMDAGFSGMQLIVLGEDDDEKIHLCVGIGTELSYQHKKCRYLTAMKVFECFYREEGDESAGSGNIAWNWQEVSLLIIDDINPSHSDIHEVITTNEFQVNIEKKAGNRNKKLLREKKVIWMLGNETQDNKEQKSWIDFLVSFDIDPTNIITINLTDKRPANGNVTV